VDLDDNCAVKYEEGNDLAESFGVPFFECSAKTGVNCSEVFEAIANQIK
jgi:hypothetical protein